MNREFWLTKTLDEFCRPLFADHNRTVPEKVKVSVGFPSSKALSLKKQAIGECWHPATSADESYQIWISPVIEHGDDAVATLVHEVAHTVAGHKAKHGPAFKRVAESVGLEGLMTATTAGELLQTKIEAWLETMPPYPQPALKPMYREKKIDKCRMYKAECPECAKGDKDDRYIVRLSRKTAKDKGLPDCPVCGTTLELEAKAEEEDDEQ